jgi:hypothetical protein
MSGVQLKEGMAPETVRVRDLVLFDVQNELN